MRKIFEWPPALLVIICLLFASPIYAASGTLTWDGSTTNVDGSQLTDLLEYRVYQSTVAGGPYTQIGTVTAPATGGGTGTFDATGLVDNTTYYFVVTAVDTTSLESANSNEVSNSIAVSPNNPMNLIITITVTIP